MKNITGIFDNKIAADHAVAELLDNGFSKNDISLIMSERTRDKLFNSTDDEASEVAKGGVTGAVVGGAIGALIAALTTVGVVFIPGAGLVVAGPMIASLSGAAAGATVGGLSGALIRAGFAADEANRYEEELKQGKAIIVVHAHDDKQAFLAESALANSGATTQAA